nr:MAG TPA: hypothetical protein [Caudoviricetes sp.]
MTENYSLSDIAAATGNDRNGNGMWGNDMWAWIVILLLFGWGRNGFGGYGNNGGGVADNYVLASDFSNIERKLDNINNGICDSTFALNNTINGNFRTLDGAVCNLGYQALQNANAIQTQLADCCCKTQTNIERNTNQGILNTNAIQQQISSCCCDVEKMNLQNRFDNQTYNCNTLQAIDKVGDRIIDYMVAEKAQTLRDENQALRLAASQSAQNQYIINALRPMPIPAYASCNPWAASYGFNSCNSGCGCNNF